jgi:AcrR family transcriptional regulator
MIATYHHGDLKTVFLTYVREQMERTNLDELSMREMAKSAGVSHAAAYRHFADKRELLDTVAILGFEEILSDCISAVQSARNEPCSKLKACGLAYVQFGLTSPRLLAHMFNSITRPQVNEMLSGLAAKLFGLLVELVIAGQSKEIFRTGDARQLSHACWAMVHGLSTLLSIGMLRSPERFLEKPLENAELAIDVFLSGIANAKN